jgi:glutamyl-tRNA reductase
VRLLALGVDHRSAPASVREALAFSGHKYASGLDFLAQTFPGNEFVILSTCNRVELYVAGSAEQMPQTDALTDALVNFHSVNSDLFSGHLVSYHDEAVVGHLFRVAASLESLVLGEGQILGQVREAYRAACDRKTVGPIFHTVFQNAFRVGKLVRERTGMDQGKVSIASVAVDLAKEVFDTFADKTVLVIGAGKMGELTLQHLKGLHPGEILVTNRDGDRAHDAAARWNGRVLPFERLGEALIEADLVISTTAAEVPIVTLEQYVRVQRARKNRLSLILDIAIPRDFDSRIGQLDQVTLYHVDDLRAQAEQNRLQRQKGIDPALAIIERETTDCYAQLRHQQDAGLLLQQLGHHAEQIRQRELSTLFATRPHLTDADREAIAHMAMRLQNQYFHHPRAAVRSAVTASRHDSDEPHPVLSFIRHLFGLGERNEK